MSDATTHIEPENRFGLKRPKVPPFARYKGTSAWRKDHRRAREYARFRAAQDLAVASKAAAPGL